MKRILLYAGLSDLIVLAAVSTGHLLPMPPSNAKLDETIPQLTRKHQNILIWCIEISVAMWNELGLDYRNCKCNCV